MKPFLTLASLAVASELGGAIIFPPEAKLGDDASLLRRSGCNHGEYLLYSTSAGPVCLGKFGVGIAVTALGLNAAGIVTYIKNTWNKPDCAQPVPGNIPVPGVPRSKSARRDSNTGLNVEITKGVDETTCTQRLSDNDWANSILAISECMEHQQDECVRAVVYENDNGFKASIVTWLQTADGANHRSC